MDLGTTLKKNRSVLPDKRPDFGGRLGGLLQKWGKTLENMGHAIPNVKGHRAPLTGGVLGQARGIIQQHLCVAHLQ
jgi:hypothetical protein